MFSLLWIVFVLMLSGCSTQYVYCLNGGSTRTALFCINDSAKHVNEQRNEQKGID